MSCPTGRGSREDEILRLLPSDTHKTAVYEGYTSCWERVVEVLMNQHSAMQRPLAPLCFKSFLRVWREHLPTLRIAKSESDFCDTCTTLSHSVQTTENVSAKEAIAHARAKHRAEDSAEFSNYKNMQESATRSPAGVGVHLTFDFAEKVLLPSLLRQPGQLHFVTGLKFDIFGVASSNLDFVYIFGLTEGHWPNNKTANETMSMVHYTLELHRAPSMVTRNYRNLNLHCDNCAGQNKNRFALWYLAWRVIMGFEDSVTLYFLVAGHTKNRCDGAFGLVKRALKQNDVNCPSEMMRVIESRAASNRVICPTAVSWLDWKRLLGEYFTLPTRFKISTYHVYRFSKEQPGTVQAKQLSSTHEWQTFGLLQRRKKVDDVRHDSNEQLQTQAFDLHATALAQVPSKQEGTRKAYLIKNVCERYHPHDTNYQNRYFDSGTNWKD